VRQTLLVFNISSVIKQSCVQNQRYSYTYVTLPFSCFWSDQVYL